MENESCVFGSGWGMSVFSMTVSTENVLKSCLLTDCGFMVTFLSILSSNWRIAGDDEFFLIIPFSTAAHDNS